MEPQFAKSRHKSPKDAKTQNDRPQSDHSVVRGRRCAPPWGSSIRRPLRGARRALNFLGCLSSDDRSQFPPATDTPPVLSSDLSSPSIRLPLRPPSSVADPIFYRIGCCSGVLFLQDRVADPMFYRIGRCSGVLFAQDRPKIAQDRPKSGQDGQRCCQDPPKTPQENHKSAKMATKMANMPLQMDL